MYIIYSKPSCSFCLQAKQLLETKQLPFVYKELGTHYSLQEFVEMFPNARSFPMIVKDGELIGGFNNLVEHLKQQY